MGELGVVGIQFLNIGEAYFSVFFFLLILKPFEKSLIGVWWMGEAEQ